MIIYHPQEPLDGSRSGGTGKLGYGAEFFWVGGQTGVRTIRRDDVPQQLYRTLLEMALGQSETKLELG